MNCKPEEPKLWSEVLKQWNKMVKTRFGSEKHTEIAEQKLTHSANKTLYFTDENQRKAELHKIEMKGKELANLAFLTDNGIITNDEFVQKSRQMYE